MTRDQLCSLGRRSVKIVLLGFLLFACAAPRSAELRAGPPSVAMAEPQVVYLLQIANRNLKARDISKLTVARSALLLAQRLAPEDARVIDGFGCVSWQLGRFEEAELFFSRAFRMDPHYARALGHLALAAYQRGDAMRARELFSEALAIHPTDGRTRNNFAVLKWDRNGATGGNLTDILEELQQAMFTSVGDEAVVIRANLNALEK